jgi:hypothetical protein
MAPEQGRARLASVHFDALDAAPGEYTFEITYADDFGQSVAVTYRAVVQAAPVFRDGDVITVHLKRSDTEAILDPIGAVVGTALQPLTANDYSAPEHGDLSLTGKGLLRYGTDPGFVGTVLFTVAVSDDLGQSAVLSYQIVIADDDTSKHIGDPPKHTGDPGLLAFTGTEIGLLAIGGLSLLLMGLGLYLGVAKRRKSLLPSEKGRVF